MSRIMPKGYQLGVLEELVLLAVLRLGRDSHAGRIRQELKALADRAVSVSTIYVTLLRLEEKGYALSWKGEASASRGGKAKRHYSVSPAGLEVLRKVRNARQRMWQGVEGIEANV